MNLPDESAVAIIGASLRFPGANTLQEFWRNVRDGVESIRRFSDADLETPAPHDPAFVPAGAAIDGIDRFDAAFFGIPRTEAEWMDPQQRLFLECAWMALEDAACDPSRYPGLISVYAGANTNTYLLGRLSVFGERPSPGLLQLLLANEKDFLATRVSYKLNLRGESITVQTSCSSSLVAVHLACQSLLTGQSDVALAGAVSIRVPQRTGYTYEQGMISSPDGHCRPFDRRAQGTVPGNGAGVVVLKRYPDAVRDCDRILALIRSTAANNDGHGKAGFTAPSVDGQAGVIGRALALAGVSAESIGYVEAHGTATPVGDPIEIEALSRAFRKYTDRRGFCDIGSVKANIGHLDTAAGIGGLLKVVLALQHREVPPLVHFEAPNPELRLGSTPFRISQVASPWISGPTPRRAGVSSFGIGGTNVHAILEEAPAMVRNGAARAAHVVTLSAKNPSALALVADQLAEYLRDRPELDLGDVAFTRNAGRAAHTFRSFVTAHDSVELAERLRSGVIPCVAFESAAPPRIAFVFSGQGVLNGYAARDLYETEPLFRGALDECATELRRRTGLDLTHILMRSGSSVTSGPAGLPFEQTLPALFAVQHSLARMWMGFGVKPDALVGHSFGEYVAATLAGVFSLPDALFIATERGRIIDTLPHGAMLAVGLGEPAIWNHLSPDLALAAVNGPDRVVVSGTPAAIAGLQHKLTEIRIHSSRLEIARAYHSHLVEPGLARLSAAIESVSRRAPSLRYISTLTGTWAEPARVTQPSYWAEQMRRTVQFAAGIETLLSEKRGVFVEAGPSQNLARAIRDRSTGVPTIVSSMPNTRADRSESVLPRSLGQLWLVGVNIDWGRVYAGSQRRVDLPPYPLQRERFWIEARVPEPALNGRHDSHLSSAVPQSEPRDVMEAPAGRTNGRVPWIAPCNDTESAVAAIWAEVLGVNDIGMNDDFLELGGDSLLATLILAKIRKTLPVDVSMKTMLSSATVASVAREIQSQLDQFPADAARIPFQSAYCAFEMNIGDECVTVHLSEEDYRTQGLPGGALNFRIVS
jgi:acyl transferase domain-containing protein